MIIRADCVEAMREMEAGSVAAVVTDPPYGLEFMGQEWDRPASWRTDRSPDKTGRGSWFGDNHDSPRHGGDPIAQQAFHHAWAAEALRVLKPGGHLLAFGGTRTYHRLACAIEDAGFEIRDCLAWLYGTGFPKSLDVSKAIDRRPGVMRHADFAQHLEARRVAAGLSRADVSEAVVGTRTGACWNWEHHQFPEAKWWPALRDLLGLEESWGEVIAEAEREKVAEHDGARLAVAPGQGSDRSRTSIDVTEPKTPEAQRWQGWGTALKPAHEPIVVARKPLEGTVAANVQAHGTGALNVDGCRVAMSEADRAAIDNMGGFGKAEGHVGNEVYGERGATDSVAHEAGRWPANVALDEEAAAMLDEAAGERAAGNFPANNRTGFGGTYRGETTRQGLTQEQRGTGAGGASRFFYCTKASTAERDAGVEDGNDHPTVKPIDLMRWLCRLVTPPGGVVLDPFTGSGTTGVAATLEGFEFTGIEREPRFAEIAEARIRWWSERQGSDVAAELAAESRRQALAATGQMELA